MLILSLTLVLTGCSGLSSEPAIVSTAPVPISTPTAVPDIGHPLNRVDLSKGKALFNGPQGCQNCHGIGGHGDGQTAVSFSCKIPNAAEPSVARSAAPADWFSITTNGNGGDQTCLMPPWKNLLDEQQRWDVASYLYSLHYDQPMIDKGAQIWAANCASCHGDTGKGDGPKASDSARPVPNFGDPANLVATSDTTLFNNVTSGIGLAMPAFAGKLDVDSLWAVVAYTRALAWNGISGASSIATAAPTSAGTAQPESPTLSITGTINNGTKQGAIPPNMAVTLRVLDTSVTPPSTTATYQTTAAVDGSFSFKDVVRQIGQAYVVMTEYAGLQQFSKPIRLAAGAGSILTLPLTLHEVTTDSANLTITQETMIVDFQDTSNAVINVGLNVANVGTHIVQTTQTDSTGAKLSIRLPLPAAAYQVTIDPKVANQFRVGNGTDGTPELENALPIFPGESRPVQFSYRLPVNSTLTLSLAVPYTVEAFDVYLPQPSGFAISDPNWQAASPISLQDVSGTTVSYLGYKLANPAAPGKPLTLTIAPQIQFANANADARRNTLSIVLILAGCSFLLVGVVSIRLNRSEKQRRITSVPGVRLGTPAERLIAQIAILDDRFEAGDLAEADYTEQRAQLKAELVALLERG